MARSPSLLEASRPDVDAINLRRALIRLEQQILVPGPDSRLLHSSYERNKTAQNLEYTRTLLLRLEHSTPNIKVQARKHAQQSELARHRALIKRLTERLYEMSRRDDEAEEFGTDGAEDIMGIYFAPEPASAKPTHSQGTSNNTGVSHQPPINSEGLRARNVNSAGQDVTRSMTTNQAALQRDQLFAGHTKSSKSFNTSSDVSAEKQLENQESTQAELTSSLVALAQQLKASSLAFAEDLALDAEAVVNTEGALGRNKAGLDAASRGMSSLRKMSEGRWFWQRYIMFILIIGLWILEFGIVFLTPKLRF